MGCLFSCLRRTNGQMPLEETAEEPKVYSWDKRDRSNVQDFVIDGKKGEQVVKHTGTVNGEQIVIQNCQDSSIYVFDHIATVSIDDCINCNIFLGPIKSSVFIRDSKQCKLVVACQQFRTRDCFQIDTFLLCATQPIIESSSRMKFACFRYYYEQLDNHFRSAGLSIFNNNWSNVHDFTPVPDEDLNFSYLPLEAKVEDFVPVPEGEEFLSMQIRVDEQSSVIPQTWGKRGTSNIESCLVVFFNDGGSSERASNFIRAVRSHKPNSLLVQTKEVSMGPNDAQNVYGTSSYANATRQGYGIHMKYPDGSIYEFCDSCGENRSNDEAEAEAIETGVEILHQQLDLGRIVADGFCPVIGLHLSGEEIVSLCQSLIVELMKGTTGLVFVSQSPDAARTQIDNFFNFADMQMGI